MITATRNNTPAALESFTINMGLNFGRFDVVSTEISDYELCASFDEVERALGAQYEQLVVEMREDDLIDDEPSPLLAMNYPELADALRAHPTLMAEVLDTFLGRALIDALLPSSGGPHVIQSIASIQIEKSQVRLTGRCFFKH